MEKINIKTTDQVMGGIKYDAPTWNYIVSL